MDQLFQILINGGIVLGVFVILLLNNRGVRKTRANLFLSVLLGAITFSTFHLRYAAHVIDHFSVKAYSLGDPTFLLIPPLLWFYIIELTGGRVRFSVAAVLHFLPFLVMIFCSLSFGSFLHDNSVVEMLEQHPRLPFIFFWIAVVAQFSMYQYFIHKKWRDYQNVIRQEVSNTENVSISWVRFFTGVFLVVNVCFLLALFAVIHFDIMNRVWKSAGIVLSLSIFALGYKGILQREIFYSDLSVPVEPPQPRSQKEERPHREMVDKLHHFMQSQKPFLDPELSLSSLSRQLNMNRNQLSQLINEGIGDNFYDFVNKYRVEEVKRLMLDPKMQKYNLLGIALEAGFKSKSTFNLIFKRFTGLTPGEYKNNLQGRN